jgi:hypothetical protein
MGGLRKLCKLLISQLDGILAMDGQCSRATVPDNAAVVDNFLRLAGGSTAMSGG